MTLFRHGQSSVGANIRFSNDFKEAILLNGIVQSKEQVHNLECKYCGAILPYFPNQGDSIGCSKCNNEQIVW